MFLFPSSFLKCKRLCCINASFLKHCWLCSCHCHQVISSCEETTKKLLSVTYTATDHQQRPFCVTREFNSGMGKLCILCLSSKGFLCLLHVSVVCFFPFFVADVVMDWAVHKTKPKLYYKKHVLGWQGKVASCFCVPEQRWSIKLRHILLDLVKL